jgi:hypothetical protein
MNLSQGGRVLNRRLVAPLAAALASFATARADIPVEAYVGGGYSDNIARVETGEKSEPIVFAGGNLGWHGQGSRVDGSAAAGFDWYHYGGNVFSDELLGHAIADLHLGLVPHRILWVVTENFGQTASDPLQPSTALNRQNVNVLSTGPDLKARWGGATTLTVSARYNNVRYEVSPSDYAGWSGQLTLGRELSAASALNLVLGHERVDYQQTVFPNYERNQAYLQYVLKGSRTTLDVIAGGSQLRQTSRRFDDPLARLTLSRRISARSTLSLSGLYGVSTGGEIFRSLQPVDSGRLPTQTFATVGDSALQSLVTGGLTTVWERTTLDIGATYGKERYTTATNNDVDHRGGNLGLTRSLTPSLTAGLLLRRERREYLNTGRAFDDTNYSLTGEKKLGRFLAVVLELSHNDRSDSLHVAGYKENVGFLRLKWARAR